MTGADLVQTLALEPRERVLPELGSDAGRAHAGGGACGDVTFAGVDAGIGRLQRIRTAYL